MTKELYNMLKSSAQADKDKALLSLELLGNKAVGIGDHSTEDFYKNAEEALITLMWCLSTYYEIQISSLT